MELDGMYDMDERVTALRAQVARECAEGNEAAREAAAAVVAGYGTGALVAWLRSPWTQGDEQRARIFGLLVMGAMAASVLAALILSA